MAQHDIKLSDARDWLGAYNNVKGANLANVEGIRFDSAKIDSILKDPKCAFLRVYLAKDPANLAAATTVVIVGVDSQDQDISTNIAEYGVHRIVASPLP